MEKDKTIASITSELSKLQKNASGAISQIREALNSEIEKNSELTEKNKKFIVYNRERCVLYEHKMKIQKGLTVLQGC